MMPTFLAHASIGGVGRWDDRSDQGLVAGAIKGGAG